VAFAPGAMSWEQNVPLQDRLVRAVDLAKAPIFLIQAENDYSLAPSRVLSKEANKKKKDFQSKIYPPFGNAHQDGHWGFCSSATEVLSNKRVNQDSGIFPVSVNSSAKDRGGLYLVQYWFRNPKTSSAQTSDPK
jgi:hypothetical protein